VAEPSSSRTTVTADRTTVMEVLSNFAAYPEWAAGMKSAEVLSSYPDGRAETVSFVIDAGPIKDRYALRYEWDPDCISFALAESGEVVKGLTGTYRLADADDGTAVTYELSTDLKMPMMGMFRGRMEKMIVQNTLKDLKRRVDTLG
jgi:ribosome-associated toxin RatA of RatAB toxin-antitoxin module